MQIKYLDDGLILITADEGKKLTTVDNMEEDKFYKFIYLGINDKVENYKEVDDLGIDKIDADAEEKTYTDLEKKTLYDNLVKVILEKGSLLAEVDKYKNKVNSLNETTEVLLSYILSLIED